MTKFVIGCGHAWRLRPGRADARRCVGPRCASGALVLTPATGAAVERPCTCV